MPEPLTFASVLYDLLQAKAQTEGAIDSLLQLWPITYAYCNCELEIDDEALNMVSGLADEVEEVRQMIKDGQFSGDHVLVGQHRFSW